MNLDATTLQEALAALKGGVLVADELGRIRYVNPWFSEHLPVRAEPVGRLPIEVVALAELQEVVDRVRGGSLVKDLSCMVERTDLVLNGTLLPSGDVLVLIDDVTDQREAERARTDFVANVSHELRTPVTAIMGYAETLLQEQEHLPAELVALVRPIDRNARRLRDLFEDLLKLHRIEVRRRELPLDVQPIRRLLEEALVDAADMAATKGVDLALECDPWLEGRVNAEALQMLVSNLALNAVAYSDTDGQVRIRGRRDGGPVVIDVVDDGIGIDPADHERIFERFFRVDIARSRRAGGTGLGLAIVKHLALASGCRVTVRSAVGQGAVFSVHIPE